MTLTEQVAPVQKVVVGLDPGPKVQAEEGPGPRVQVEEGPVVLSQTSAIKSSIAQGLLFLLLDVKTDEVNIREVPIPAIEQELNRRQLLVLLDMEEVHRVGL